MNFLSLLTEHRFSGLVLILIAIVSASLCCRLAAPIERLIIGVIQHLIEGKDLLV